VRESPEPDGEDLRAPRRSGSRLPRLSLITGDFTDPADLALRARLALQGGVRWIQLRARQLAARDLYDGAVILRSLTRDFDATLIVNDRVDVALAVGADGVHLPSSGLAPADVRALVGDGLLIGLSVHSQKEIETAADQGLDYVQFGPVYDTPSKRVFGPPQGSAALAAAAAAAHAEGLFLVAVGGTAPSRVTEIAAAGADAIATIGAIWNAADVRGAAQEFVMTVGAVYASRRGTE